MTNVENTVARRAPGGKWLATRLATPVLLTAPEATPLLGEPGTKPLQRHRRGDESPVSPFHPGWARMGWTESALVVDFIFFGANSRNRARRLNERTYLLGDVGEIFLQWPGSDRYIEIHVTPENQRLQLAWTSHALSAVRRGKATLEDQAVVDRNWVESVTSVEPTQWSARVRVPAATIKPDEVKFEVGGELIASICRYDYSGGEPPLLSSTADYRGGRFHDRAAWHRVVLSP